MWFVRNSADLGPLERHPLTKRDVFGGKGGGKGVS